MVIQFVLNFFSNAKHLKGIQFNFNRSSDMKTSMIRIACVLLMAAMLTLGFAGCGQKAADTWNIGATGPLTGDASSYGISVKNGAELAIEEINKAGGLAGFNFKFDMKDDQATPEGASSGYDTLYEAGMQASIGSVTSGSCLQFGTKAARDNLFFITPSASAQNVIETGSNAFRVCFGDPDQGVLAARKIVDDGYAKIGAIYDNSDPYSSGIYDAFTAEMAKLGKTFTTQSFDKENNKDFTSIVEALKDCDIIFCPFYYTEASLVAKTCATKGVNAVLFGCDGFDGIADMFTEADVISNKILYITPFDVNSTESKSAAFVNAYKAKYGSAPDQFAADGYDAVYVIFNAMKKAGVTDVKISASDLCNAIKTAILSSDFSYAGVTGTMTWDATGACNKTPIIVEYKR